MGTAKNAINKSINDKTNMYSINDNNVCNDNTNMYNNDNIEEITIDYILENNLIENKLLELLENENIDIYNINSRQFTHYMRRACKPFFYKTNILKCNNKYNIYSGSMTVNNNTVINWINVKKLYDYYVNLADKYNKYILLYYFISITYIGQDAFYNDYDINNIYVTNEGVKVLEVFSKCRNDIIKDIHNNQENIIESKLADSNNITGAIAIANKKFGYSDSSQKQPQITNNYINYNQLPDFSEKMPQIGQNNP